MKHEVLERAEAAADFLRDQGRTAEIAMRLPDETVKKLRDIGVVRMFMPKEFGGYEAHPVDFFKTVMEIGAHDSAAGWVAGVCGVHSWHFALVDPKLQEEVWGTNPDTWSASPYAPMGRAKPVPGGYEFSGRWSFSSGTDHSDWITLGGMVTDADGQLSGPPVIRHFILPRGDWTIHHDSWDVMALRGTGSKDVTVDAKFVPDYRVNDLSEFNRGDRARALAGRDVPLYRVPFDSLFPAAINAATLGIAEGALAAYINYTRDRMILMPQEGIVVAKADPHHLALLGEVASDVASARTVMFDDWNRIMDAVEKPGSFVSDEMRITTRTNQVRAVRRAADAVDKLFYIAGGTSLQLSHPMQRFWRDMHGAMVHLCNLSNATYQNYGRITFGADPQRGIW